jgi:branched-chain amino acid transport system permease protein
VTRRGLAVLGAGAAAALPWLTADPYYLHMAIALGLNAALALSLSLVMVAGHLSIAHAAFMGIGAYASALLVMRAGLPFWLALPVAGVTSAAVAVLLGVPALRVRGANFAILTFSFGEVVRLVFVAWVGLFGGAGGLVGIPAPPPLPLGPATVTFEDKRAYLYLVLALLAVTWAVVAWFLGSHVGRVLRAIAEAEMLAGCSGVNVMGYRLMNFAVAAGLAGMAGSVHAHYFRYISPDSFSFLQSIEIITFVVLGGVGTVVGPVLGAVVLTALPEVLRMSPGWDLIVYAIALMVVLLFLPDGLVGLRRLLRMRPATLGRSRAHAA